MASPTFLKYRRMLITGCVAAITVTGAWYGAGLKTKQEIAVVRTSHNHAFSVLTGTFSPENQRAPPGFSR